MWAKKPAPKRLSFVVVEYDIAVLHLSIQDYSRFPQPTRVGLSHDDSWEMWSIHTCMLFDVSLQSTPIFVPAHF